MYINKEMVDIVKLKKISDTLPKQPRGEIGEMEWVPSYSN